MLSAMKQTGRRPLRPRPPRRVGGRRAAPLHAEPPPGVERGPDRLVARGSDERVLAIGLRRPWFGDLYHRTLTIGWPAFLLSGGALYIALNILFALLYLIERGSIAEARPGTFADAFFFSVQTMATIGYGHMRPATLWANLLVTVESLVGLMFLAIATGLVFARFSRPTARVRFSRVAVIGPYDGKPTLSLRLANERLNQILQAEVTLTLVRDEATAEGTMMRRFYDLKLARERTPIFALSFTLMHEIDRASPLCGATPASLAARHAELVVTATGLDETLAHTVHARASYLPHEILWDHRFADMFGWTEDGRRAIDYRQFDSTVSLRDPG
jgi:inward rectifier potassium channel